MRTLLAVASLVMLVGVGAGCGDDTTTATSTDMAMSLDMTAAATDMQKLTCGQILTCAQACTSQSCLTGCIANGKSASQTKAQALFGCAIGACTVDGGIDAQCISTTVTKAVAGMGACASQGQACTSDM